ncbi:NlpC/P60 family protein [Longispora sp. K20-0274]|uniref:C40 family peptidase n=1 Tax=Longispora sp. K20-0274 TaxID=3088255 RepID=UPI00399B58C8
MSFAGSAHADDVDELERQLDAKWSSLETTIEQYNKTAATLKSTKAEAEAASVKVKPLQDKVDAAYAQIGQMSAAAYKGGKASATNALLGGTSADAVLQQLTLLDAISSSEQKQIDELNKLKAPLDAEKKKIQALLDAQQKMETELAAKKVSITGEMTTLQTQRAAAYKDRASRAGQRIDYVPPFIPGPPGKAVSFALAQIGKPYVWAAAGPDSYDCSGLTMAAWAQGGVSFGHYTGWQRDASTPITRSQLQPGDLIFYGGDRHVAMYIGNNLVVHAPQPGQNVKIESVDMGGDNPTAYARPKYAH